MIKQFWDTRTLFTDLLMQHYHLVSKLVLLAKAPLVLSQAANKHHTGRRDMQRSSPLLACGLVCQLDTWGCRSAGRRCLGLS